MYINHICTLNKSMHINHICTLKLMQLIKKISFDKIHVWVVTSIFERLFKYINFRFLLKYKVKTHFILLLKQQRERVSCTLNRALNNIFQCDGVHSDDARA